MKIGAQEQKFTVSGYVYDASNGESLIGASVYVTHSDGRKTGAATNVYGFYSIQLNEGNYELVYSYVGFATQIVKINLKSNLKQNVHLIEGQELSEVVVTAERKDENVKSTDMGKVEMGIEMIKSIPALMGEVDVIKAIQLLPGVQAAGEGNSGIYVRGGGPDQNLVLLDDAIVYNPGHMFGFFSVFNPDAVKGASLTKGGMPASYGGRISSVIDVSMKEGNNKRFQMDGGIGLISSRLTLQGPIQKDKSSFLIAARRTYAFDIAQPILKKTDFGGTNYNFYDLNLKANYTFSDKDRIFLSGYFGRDVFIYNNAVNKTNVRMPWGNATTTLRWNHLFSDKLFMNTTLVFNDYQFSFTARQLEFQMLVKSGVRDFNAKIDLDHYASSKHKLKYGYNYTYHIFTPNTGSMNSGDTDFKIDEGKKYAHEMAWYVQDDWDINDRFRLSTGFRLSMFQQVGPYKYLPDGAYGKDSVLYKRGEAVKTWWGPEPRIAMRYAINGKQSIKAGFSMNYQYVHLVSSSNSTLPTDMWVPSSKWVEPQWGLQYSLGYFRNFKDNDYELSAEIYYKDMKNQIEFSESFYKELNEEIEMGYVFGRGYSYGMELFAKKSKGKFNGWLGYTLSYTWRKFDMLNQGNKFPARYDRRHDISVNLVYEINKKLSLGGTWVYATGNAFTLPIEKYIVDFMLITGYGDRNAYRIPAFHRMDLSLTYVPNKNPNKRFKSEYNFSIYNVYNRKNTYFIYYKTEGNLLLGNLTTKAVSVSLFPIIPSFTWNFKF
ncbi:MAG: TonB-dependent receptor [Chitinophagales bacterium]|nr:TonB-dependent receptor [Chitinophagales bacterium]MCZ2392257.1 TonB-dependent receptor [Chitinophagales bacterium]